MIENRNGLIVEAMATTADGTSERDAAMLMVGKSRTKKRLARRRTLGADKGYDTHDFIEVTRAIGVTPHVTQNLTRPGGSAIDARTTRHEGYAMSQHARASDRAGLRMVEDDRVASQNQAAWPPERGLARCLRQRGVQSAAVGDIDRGAGMNLADASPATD